MLTRSLARCATLPLLLLLCQAGYSADPVKVFILAGQSNMVGHGKTEYGLNVNFDPGQPVSGTNPKEVIGGPGSLRKMVADNWATYGVGGPMQLVDDTVTLADVQNTANTPIAWRVRTDVNILARTEYLEDSSGNVTNNGVTRTGGLTVGGFAATNGFRWIGPELGFGHVLGDALDQDILLIKVSTGGTDLDVNWRSPSAAARSGEVGFMWTHMVSTVNDTLTNLDTIFPEYAGRTAEIAGFGWHQGWNDRVDGTKSAAYEDNLADLINDVRSEFGESNLPFVIGTTGMAPGATYSTVELAQLAVADSGQHPEFAGTVATVDTRPYWRDSTESPSNFGYHWNHNGLSHFDVGVGMAEAMVTLVPEPGASVVILAFALFFAVGGGARRC
jgi:hypothetical protein